MLLIIYFVKDFLKVSCDLVVSIHNPCTFYNHFFIFDMFSVWLNNFHLIDLDLANVSL